MTKDLPLHVDTDPALWQDFLELCDFGGRLAGSPSEIMAREWAAGRFSAIEGGKLSRQPTPYVGWQCSKADVTLPSGETLETTPLLCCAATPPSGLEIEVVDCGRGTPDDIHAAGPHLRGRAALVRHEYMFSEHTVHRRVKLKAAIDAGAAAFLIAAPEQGLGAVSGSSGLAATQGANIPALGISAEAASKIIATPGGRIRIDIAAEFQPDTKTETLILDLPGLTSERVVLSAHIDGHATGESALDNATGVALALALARTTARYKPALPRGLTVCLFSAEEWALTGSKVWLSGLPHQERENLVFNLNLDTVTGGSRLTALTSGFRELGAFVQQAAVSVGAQIGVHSRLMPNSDHANFAALGIPALRLVSGFNEPDSKIRFLLTQRDRRGLVAREDFTEPMRVAWAVLRAALTAPLDRLINLRATQ